MVQDETENQAARGAGLVHAKGGAAKRAVVAVPTEASLKAKLDVPEGLPSDDIPVRLPLCVMELIAQIWTRTA